MPNDMRDRLIELYDQTNDECDVKDCLSCKYWNASYCRVHKFIDKIIANGVILPPCKVGDTYYRILYGKIYENEFICTATIVSMMEDGAFGETVFLTREDAEKALREMGK